MDSNKKENENTTDRNPLDINSSNTDGSTAVNPSTGVTPSTGDVNSPFNRNDNNLSTEVNPRAGKTLAQV